MAKKKLVIRTLVPRDISCEHMMAAHTHSCGLKINKENVCSICCYFCPSEAWKKSCQISMWDACQKMHRNEYGLLTFGGGQIILKELIDEQE